MSEEKKTIFIGTLPPPYDGQSVAFKILVDSLGQDIPFTVLNISEIISKSKNGYIYITYRVLDYAIVFIKLLYYLINGYRNVYLQISQSSKGFLRDRIIINTAKLFNCKIIAHLHGGNYDNFYNSANLYLQKRIRNTLAKVDTMILLSDRFANMFDFMPNFKNKLVSIPNGTGTATLADIDKVIVHNKPIKLLYLSNLIETKGYLFVLDAVKILVEKYGLNIEASFCGRFSVNSDTSIYKSTEEAQVDFLNRIEKYNLRSYIKYEGVVVGDEKQLLLDQAHFFILPTKYVNEGQPISIIEAMRAGCVVITSNFRAMPEMIVHKENGFLLGKIEAHEIANAVMECFNDSEVFSRISKKAIKIYNEKYTSEIHCEKIKEIIN